MSAHRPDGERAGGPRRLTRGGLLLRAVAGTGAMLAGPTVARALAADGAKDADILRFAITLEELQVDFYERAAELDISAESKRTAAEFAGHQRAFVKALTDALASLGGKPGPSPRASFPPIINDGMFGLAAALLEDTGVAVLNGAAPNLADKDLLAAAGAIVATESAHATTWRLRVGDPPTAAAFDEQYSQARALEALGPFLPG